VTWEMRLALLLVAALATRHALCAEEAGAAGAESATAEKPTDEAQAEQPAEEVAAEPIVLNCHGTELIEPVDTWSIDCVAQWLENMGFSDLKAPFMENEISGLQLKKLTVEQLQEEYGVAEEDNRKKLVYALKDVVRKDNYKGNTNNWAQFFMWALPFLGIYKWLTIKYEKQITRMNKKYKKWQETRTPVEVPPPAAADESNEWIAGMNSDLGSGKKGPKKEKRVKKVQ